MILMPRDRIERYTANGWWGRTTVDDLFRERVAAGGDALALVDPANREQLTGHAPRRLSWGALEAAVSAAAGRFQAAGLAKDAIVLIQLPNIVEAVVTFLACARLGLIASPVAMQYREHELRHIAGSLEPAAIVTIGRFGGHDHAAMMAGLSREVPSVGRLFVWGGTGLPGAEALSLDDPAVAVAPVAVDANDVLTVCWTSGTEARPKGVPRCHNHWVVNAHVCAEACDMRPGEVILNPFPLINIASIGGMIMPWLLRSGVMVLHHPFDLPTFLGQIQAERVNFTIAPPAILNMLLKNTDLMKRTDLSSVRIIGSGSAPLSPWMVEGYQRDFGIHVVNIFGSNEGASLFSGPRDIPDPVQRAQYFPRFGVPGIDWATTTSRMIRTRLVDLDTETEITAPGRPGELRIDGAMTFGGYWRADALNAAAFDAEGFYRTGDLFEIAGDGDLSRFYRFVGRCKDIIIRGGVNISPAELDELLVGDPRIREAAVVGVPDANLGERVCAVVVPAPGFEPTLEDVVAYLRSRQVAVFKLPERLKVLPALPRNPMGKVLRAEVRRLAGEPAGEPAGEKDA